MLETIIVALLVLWALGFWGPYRVSAGHFVHLLLAAAVVVLVARMIQGHRLL